MDPDACLKIVLANVQTVLALEDDEEQTEFQQAAAVLAEHVLALDAWIVAGGFLPERWKRAL
jgi:hypothetical protein